MLHVILSLVAFIITIGFLVAIHEYGHLLVARLVGVRVLRFSIGFGRKLWSRQSRRTGIEYQVAAIPLGGYVKMLDERETEVAPEDQPYAFNRVHPWRRIAVLLAGPGVNIIFAVMVFWGLFMAGTTAVWPVAGEPVPHKPAAIAGVESGDHFIRVAGHKVNSWNDVRLHILKRAMVGASIPITLRRDGVKHQLIIPVRHQPEKPKYAMRLIGLSVKTPPYQPVVVRVDKHSPAANAGIEQGSQIVAINSQRLQSSSELIDLVQVNPGQIVQVSIRQPGGRLRTVAIELGITHTKNGQAIGRLGIGVRMPADAARAMHVQIRNGFWEAGVQALGRVWYVTEMTFQFMAQLARGEASMKTMGGPVAIGNVGGDMLANGLKAFLGFLAVISLSLGLLNLIPVPILDGGQIVMSMMEWIIRRPIPAWIERFSVALGAALLVLLMIVATYGDIQQLIG